MINNFKYFSRYLHTMLLAIVIFMTKVVSASPAETFVLAKIHSTRIITAHLSLGYGRSSLHGMSRLLSPSDVPTLLQLYFHKEDRLGVKFALTSQCGASLDALMRLTDENSVDRSTFPAITYSDINEFRDITSDIAKYDRCDANTRARATQFLDRLKSLADIESAKMKERYKKKQEEHDRQVAEGIEQLKAYTNGTLKPSPRSLEK